MSDEWTRLCRVQRAAYFALQAAPPGKDTEDARAAYLAASKAQDDFQTAHSRALNPRSRGPKPMAEKITRSKPFDEGTVARALMKPRGANPYPAGSSVAAEWDAGWCSAADLDDQDGDEDAR